MWEFLEGRNFVMRRLCAIFAGALLLLGLAACGEDEPVSSRETLAESARSSLEETESELEVLTVEEIVDRFLALSPKDLGLTGESFDEYEVLHQPGSIPVDGLPCLELRVYEKNQTDTNTPLGTYLFARDGSALYQLDVSTDTLTKLDLG